MKHLAIIPTVFTFVACLALLGCGDLGTGPSVDELGPEFRRVPASPCPPGFTEKDLQDDAAEIAALDALNDPALVDGNGDTKICVGTRGGQTFFTDNNVGTEL